MRDDHELLRARLRSGRAVANPFVDRWSPAEREAFVRDSAAACESNWEGYVQRALEGLVQAHFAHRVLVRGEAPWTAARASAALDAGTGDPVLDRRLLTLREDRARLEPAPGRERRHQGAAWVERMGRMFRDAEELREVLEEEVRRHLLRGGLTPGEIERRTEEAARLWRAA